MSLRLKLLILVALVSAPLAHATKLYKWIDNDGKISYHDQPPSEAGYRVEEKNLGVRTTPKVRVPPSVLEKFPVVLYSAPKCGSCDTARAYLNSRGVPFSEKNVDGDRKLQDELIKRTGGLSVPTITIGAKVMKGYLETLLEGELDDAGYPKAGAEETPETEQQEKPNS